MTSSVDDYATPRLRQHRVAPTSFVPRIEETCSALEVLGSPFGDLAFDQQQQFNANRMLDQRHQYQSEAQECAMSEMGSVAIARVLGWKLTDDKSHVMIGFTLGPHDSDFAIALSHQVLVNTIINMVGALDAFQESNITTAARFSIDATWNEIEQVGTNQFVVSFRTKGGGILRFMMDRPMTEGLSERLRAVLGDLSG